MLIELKVFLTEERNSKLREILKLPASFKNKSKNNVKILSYVHLVMLHLLFKTDIPMDKIK